MSTGQDLVNVAKDAKEIYNTAKQLKENLVTEEFVAESEIEKLKNFNQQMFDLVNDLPDQINQADSIEFIELSIAVLTERIEDEDDQNERANLKDQRADLNDQKLNIDLNGILDIRSSIRRNDLDELLMAVREAQVAVESQMKVAGYTKLALKSGVLLIDLGKLVAKAAV